MKSGSTNITERVGRTVLYTLTADDARYIMERRRQLGAAQASANDVRDGDTYPAIIVRDFGTTLTPGALANWQEATGQPGAIPDPHNAVVNIRVILDGYDTYWATSRSEFDPEKHGRLEQRTVNESDSDEGDWIPDSRGHWQFLAENK